MCVHTCLRKYSTLLDHCGILGIIQYRIIPCDFVRVSNSISLFVLTFQVQSEPFKTNSD